MLVASWTGNVLPHAIRRKSTPSDKGRKMKKTFGVSLLAVALPLVATGNASASQPTLERVPIDGTFVDESCGFAVRIETTGFIVRITWVDQEGNGRRIEAAPQAKQTLTNLETSETIDLNIAGPSQFTFNQDGSFRFVGTGTWSWTNNIDTGEPGLFLTEGRFVAALDSAGNFSFSRVGNMVDLCARLAP